MFVSVCEVVDLLHILKDAYFKKILYFPEFYLLMSAACQRVLGVAAVEFV